MTLPLLAAAAQAAQAAADGTLSLAWLTVALPLAGFLANGLIALRWPRAKAAVSVIGPAVLIGAFAVALALFFRVRAIGLEEPFIQRLWTWIPSGSLVVDFAFQVDQLSLVMLLVVTGVYRLLAELEGLAEVEGRQQPVHEAVDRRMPVVDAVRDQADLDLVVVV